MGERTEDVWINLHDSALKLRKQQPELFNRPNSTLLDRVTLMTAVNRQFQAIQELRMASGLSSITKQWKNFLTRIKECTNVGQLRDLLMTEIIPDSEEWLGESERKTRQEVEKIE